MVGLLPIWRSISSDILHSCRTLVCTRVAACRFRQFSQESGSAGDFSHDSHSHSEETFEDDGETEYETKQRVLSASLPFVHTQGWTHSAIAKGAEIEGLPGVAHGLFPRGGVELVFYFYNDCNRRLADQLAIEAKAQEEEQKQEPAGAPKIRPFIKIAVERRLRMITPYIDKWPQAMAMMALPQNIPEAVSNLTNLTDEIWYHAGDTSTDFNWYTKRAMLAAVYKSTEIFMVQDRSEDYQDTWDFLDRRVEDLGKAGKALRNTQETGAVFSEALLGFCIMGRNILGMNSRAK